MQPTHRIVSLIASATEIICALGLEHQLVGISHECDYPAGIQGLPVCTGPKFETDGSSYDIDQRVKAILQESLSVYKVDAELLDSLAPTQIVTQSQCEVCAVSLRDVEDAACSMIKSRPQIVSLQPNSLGDLYDDILQLGTALSVPESARALVASMKSRVKSIADAARIPAKEQVRCAFVEWIDPLMLGGNWMPELLAFAGTKDVFGRVGEHAPAVSWDEFMQLDSDVIIVAPCGFDMRRTNEEMRYMTERPDFAHLRAVRDNRVYIADGNQYFNRPGPRLIESLEIVAEICYPGVFSFGHRGSCWLNYAEAAPYLKN